MSANTSIQWTDRTWNPVRGCSRVSPGCDSCYAMGISYRFSGAGRPYEGLALKRGPSAKRPGPDWTGKVRLVPKALTQPVRWRRRSRIFVNSMSDLFHDSLSDEQIDRVFGAMWACLYLGREGAPGHTFQILTKRAERLRDYMAQDRRKEHAYAAVHVGGSIDPDGIHDQVIFHKGPHPRIWLGVSAEDQQHADERIPLLLRTPAAVRFVSVEPQLGPIDMRPYLHRSEHQVCPKCLYASNLPEETCPNDGTALGIDVAIDWIVQGGESGRSARPFDVAWARSLRDQCREAQAAYFLKQLGADPHDSLRGVVGGWCPGDPEPDTRIVLKDSHGGDMAEWPEDLRVREFPE